MAARPDKVTVIVPAYNEAERIGTVLDVLTRVKLVDEVMVVNDGSNDTTSEVARRHNVRVIDRVQNGGKGAAVQSGIQAVDADIILFIDADLIGIKPTHIEDLITPLLEEKDLMMTVGKFTGGRVVTDLAQSMIPFISGQRAVRKEFLLGLPDLSNTGFGVEVAITQHAKRHGYKVREVLIPEATQVMKEEKMGLFGGFKARMKMYSDILKQYIVRKPNKTGVK